MILVTGASGTVGTEVVKSLARQGARLRLHYCARGAGELAFVDELQAAIDVSLDLADRKSEGGRRRPGSRAAPLRS